MRYRQILNKQNQPDLFPDYDKEHRNHRFDKWFADSLAYHGDKPMVFYHATAADFDEFKTKTKGISSVLGMMFQTDRHGAFFAVDPKFAEEYITVNGEYKNNSRVIPVYLSISNPIDLRNNVLGRMVANDEIVDEFFQYGVDIRSIAYHMYEHDRWQLFDGVEGEEFVEALQKMGFDGAVMSERTDIANDGTVWVVFHPWQIKSAISNNGAFSAQSNKISEARRNPAINNQSRRSGGIADLLKYANDPNYFVTFTELPKVGINPNSSYSTPTGIYCYPLADENEQIAYHIVNDTIPFAGDKAWINVLKINDSEDRVVHLQSQSSYFQKYNDRVADWLVKNMPLYRDLSSGELQLMVNEKLKKDIIYKRIYNYAAENAFVKTSGGIWWAFTRIAALLVRQIAIDNKPYKQNDLPDLCAKADGNSIKNGPSMWTKLMRDIGVDAVIDINGGIIHANEPTQAVFFNTGAFKIVDRIHNPRKKMDKTIDISSEKDLTNFLRLLKSSDIWEEKLLAQLVHSILTDEGYLYSWKLLHPYTKKLSSVNVEFFPWKGMSKENLLNKIANFVKTLPEISKDNMLNKSVILIANIIYDNQDNIVKQYIDFLAKFMPKNKIADACKNIFYKYNDVNQVYGLGDHAKQEFEDFKIKFGLD